MKLMPVSAALSLLLLSACGSTPDGAKTIKIEDDASVSDDVGADGAADATTTKDTATSDVSTLDVKSWPDGIAPDGFDVNLGELSLEDAVLDDSTDQTDEDGGTSLDVKSWPDGIEPDAGPDAIVVDVVVDVIGIDVTGQDTTVTDSGSQDIKSLPDTFGTDAGPDIKVDISAADTGKDISVADVPVNCDGPGGCYACPPTTNAQFLNQCNNLSSASFDNKGRLPLLKPDGSLPPLP